jgi:hypothetical protein
MLFSPPRNQEKSGLAQSREDAKKSKKRVVVLGVFAALREALLIFQPSRMYFSR